MEGLLKESKHILKEFRNMILAWVQYYLCVQSKVHPHKLTRMLQSWVFTNGFFLLVLYNNFGMVHIFQIKLFLFLWRLSWRTVQTVKKSLILIFLFGSFIVYQSTPLRVSSTQRVTTYFTIMTFFKIYFKSQANIFCMLFLNFTIIYLYCFSFLLKTCQLVYACKKFKADSWLWIDSYHAESWQTLKESVRKQCYFWKCILHDDALSFLLRICMGKANFMIMPEPGFGDLKISNPNLSMLNPVLHNNAFWHLWNIMYYYEKWKNCSKRGNAPFSITFSKVYKTSLKFLLIFFQHCLKIENDVMILKQPVE